MGPAITKLRLLAALLSMGAVLGTLLLSSAVLAEGDEIRITSEEVAADFPNNVVFKLTVTGPEPIEEVRVFVKPVGSERSAYGYLDIVPGTEVSGEYVMITGTGTSHKPPGTTIRYYYEIRDTAGQVLRTEDKEFLYLDSSLAWKSIPDDVGLLTVYYYGDFVERRAREVMDASQRTLEDMGDVLGIRPEEPINIVAYSNYRDMSRALPFRSQTVTEGLTTEGQAYAAERVLLVLISEADFSGVVSHEFTHILVAEAAGRGYARVPLWLNEGLAEYGNIDKTPYYDYSLAYGVYTRRLKPLWYLETFGGDPDDILIAYGQSRSVVKHMIDTYGPEKMTELMSAFRSALSADQALLQVYGFDQFGLDTEWRQAVGLLPLPSPEELEGRAAPDQTPTPALTPTPLSEATAVPTPLAQATPVAVAASTEGEAPAVSDEGTPRTSRSCGGAPTDTAGLGGDVAMLALLGAPFIGLYFRRTQRRSLITRLLSRTGRALLKRNNR